MRYLGRKLQWNKLAHATVYRNFTDARESYLTELNQGTGRWNGGAHKHTCEWNKQKKSVIN